VKAAPVQAPETFDVAGKGPQHGVRIEAAVTVAVIPHLYLSIVRHAIPELSGVFTLAVALWGFSPIAVGVTRDGTAMVSVEG